MKNAGQTLLTFTGAAQIAGADAGDFTIPSGDDLCDGQTLQPEQDCWIGVQFTAAAAGSRAATLSFGANNAPPPNPTVAFSGTGVPANSGPAGQTGATGPQGPRGNNGSVELVTCKTVSHTVVKKIHGKRKKVTVSSQACTTKTLPGPVG